MKKLLFMAVAMLVMVSCGSKEKKNLTPEQQAEKFAKECIDGIIAGDRAAVDGVVTDIMNYVESLDGEVKETFIETFHNRYHNLAGESADEESDKAKDFILNNFDAFEPLLEAGIL